MNCSVTIMDLEVVMAAIQDMVVAMVATVVAMVVAMVVVATEVDLVVRMDMVVALEEVTQVASSKTLLANDCKKFM
jgi:hypothetical protein